MRIFFLNTSTGKKYEVDGHSVGRDVLSCWSQSNSTLQDSSKTKIHNEAQSNKSSCETDWITTDTVITRLL